MVGRLNVNRSTPYVARSLRFSLSPNSYPLSGERDKRGEHCS
jgi:hypothetical protein